MKQNALIVCLLQGIQLSKEWKPQVTTLRTIKNLDSISIEELIGTLNVPKQELQKDKGFKKETIFYMKEQN